jgi:hypothetical protein
LARASTAIGVVGGVLGFLTWIEAHLTPVDVKARADIPGYPQLISVDIVNRASHAITLVAGEVKWQGQRVGDIAGVVPASSLAAVPSPAEIAKARRLPYAIPAGAAVAATLVWTEGGVSSPDVVDAYRAALAQSRDALRPATRLPTIDLSFEPGGTKTRRVELPATGPGDILNSQPGIANGWGADIVTGGGDTGRVLAIRVNTPSDAPATLLSRPLEN